MIIFIAYPALIYHIIRYDKVIGKNLKTEQHGKATHHDICAITNLYVYRKIIEFIWEVLCLQVSYLNFNK